jgi:putative glycerol-1-phosphate prenyltransferase
MADALLFLSIISGRNADHLIGQHVLAAPAIRQLGLEAISTGYMMIESDRVSSAEFISNTRPIPRNKPDVAAAHAMAAELLGMKLIYLEAGSGAGLQVPCEIVRAVSRAVSLPIIVGGGIRSPEDAAALVNAGASIIVIGNHFEEEEHRKQLGVFARAIHGNGSDQVRCL